MKMGSQVFAGSSAGNPNPYKLLLTDVAKSRHRGAGTCAEPFLAAGCTASEANTALGGTHAGTSVKGTMRSLAPQCICLAPLINSGREGLYTAEESGLLLVSGTPSRHLAVAKTIISLFSMKCY